MNQFIRNAVLTVTLAAGLIGCAHQREIDGKLDREVQAEPSAAPGGQLASSSRKLIQDSAALSGEQKEKLLALHTRMAADAAAIREQEGKAKMVLFKTLLNPEAKEAEIAGLKDRILKLDRQKTNRMLSALEEAREILGRKSPQLNDGFYRAFLGEHGGFGDF